MRCKRWIAHAVLTRVEETINQYTRTKIELEHLKKHKVGSWKTCCVEGLLFDFNSRVRAQANIKRVSKAE